VTALPGQLDLDALLERAYALRDKRRLHELGDGAARLLTAMYERGLADRDVLAAAALAVELDQPYDRAAKRPRQEST